MMTVRSIHRLGMNYSPVFLRNISNTKNGNVSCRMFHNTRYQLQQQQQQRSDAQSKAYEYYRRKGRSSSSSGSREERNRILASYAVAAVVGALGATYASVPLYKLFCQATGFGGTTQRVTLESNEPPGFLDQLLGTKKRRVAGGHTWRDEEAAERLKSLKPVENGRLITVRMDSTVGDVLPWTFVPTQLEVKVVPGETALSFFTATNHSPNQAITGVATYNVHPPKAGLYFSKIQCFCFEEQRLLPGETVDMPVLFFIDPDFLKDPQLSTVNNITLSYTFFQTDTDDNDDEDDDDDEDETIQTKKPLKNIKQ